MRTVLVANRKGGCGKTLTAVTLAAALAGRGGTVALADADPQKSALRWLKRRPATAAPILALDWTKADDVGEAPKRLDWLVIDAPGALKGSRAEALIGEAEAVLTPVLPSAFDADSTRRFLKEIEELKRVRKGKAVVRLLANRTRASGKAVERLRGFFAAIGQEPIAWITERAAYGDLAEEGLSVFDKPQRSMAAAREQWAPVLVALEEG